MLISAMMSLSCVRQVEAALQVFDDMRERGCERNVITYSSLICACERAGQWQLALRLFEDMQRDGCRPNVVTCNALLSACAQGGPPLAMCFAFHCEELYQACQAPFAPTQCPQCELAPDSMRG